MIEYDERNNYINNKLLMISATSNNNRHHVTKEFTPLHPNKLHATSLNLATLHFFPFNL